MKYTLLFFILIQTSLASYPEYFGSSYSTGMIGNQNNADENDPSNNYYIPALLAFSKSVNFLANASSTATHFDEITNVVVTNSTNSSSTTYGNVKTDYPKFIGGALHFGLPVGYSDKGFLGTLGLSVFLPIGSLIETHSGDPFLPEYVMYRSRFQRTSIYLNFAKSLSEEWAFSLGTIVGFQASADVKANLSLNGASYGSWARAQSKVSPSLGAIVSVINKTPVQTWYFTFQQEMKSNLSAHANGEINNPSLALFDSNIDSVIFYDPYTFRLGGNTTLNDFKLHYGVEYMLWSGYQPPTIKVGKVGGVIVPSSNYEQIVTRDTINPRIGLSYDFTNRVTGGIGAAYRMSPLDSDFSKSGNSIDTDSIIFSTGFQYRIVIWSKDVSVGSSLQYHHLQDKTVVKTANQENGNSGTKLGGPGYNIGGHILNANVGIKFNF